MTAKRCCFLTFLSLSIAVSMVQLFFAIDYGEESDHLPDCTSGTILETYDVARQPYVGVLYVDDHHCSLRKRTVISVKRVDSDSLPEGRRVYVVETSYVSQTTIYVSRIISDREKTPFISKCPLFIDVNEWPDPSDWQVHHDCSCDIRTGIIYPSTFLYNERGVLPAKVCVVDFTIYQPIFYTNERVQFYLTQSFVDENASIRTTYNIVLLFIFCAALFFIAESTRNLRVIDISEPPARERMKDLLQKVSDRLKTWKDRLVEDISRLRLRMRSTRMVTPEPDFEALRERKDTLHVSEHSDDEGRSTS
jgi:hypothetical protein